MSSLERLLDLLVQGRVRTLVELADDLGVGLGLVDQMLADLGRAGYVDTVVQACDCRCDDCEVKSAPCSLVHSGRIWTVTQKGYRAAADPGS